MPQQMVCPSSWFSSRVDVFASKEISLRIQLLDLQLTSLNFFIDPLMRIERLAWPHHRPNLFLVGDPSQLGHPDQYQPGNLNLHMHTAFRHCIA